jgi:hypothetical protein
MVRERAKKMFEMLPNDQYLSMRKAHPETFSKNEEGSMNSLGVFCSQEIDRFNRLLGVIRT